MSKENKSRETKKYSQDDVNNAVDAVKKGMSLRVASKTFGVPYCTIYVKFKNIVPLMARKGPQTYLRTEEENNLVEWIFYLSERGFPVNKNQLLDSVRDVIVELKRETPFVNNRPGRHWYEAFLRRHPQLTSRVAQTLTLTRASATEKVLLNWFKEVEQHLRKLNLLEIEPSRVFNCDESGFQLCPKPGCVIVKKGSKSVYKIANGDEKKCLTSLFMVNAAGSIVPPMVVHWYQQVPYSVSSKMPAGWSIDLTEKGWMTAESFFEFISNIFYSWLIKNQIKFPVVLYLDGHSSHLTLPLVQFCRSNQIELIALYPNATHIFQPLDVSVFHPIKNAWQKTVCNWRLKNEDQRLRKDFAPILKTTLDSLTNLESMIKNGFKTCGLLPFSVNTVNFNILDKNKKPGCTENETNYVNLNSSNNKHEYNNHLQMFEKNIDSEILKDFKSAELTRSWVGPIQYEGLFMYWMNIKQQCGVN